MPETVIVVGFAGMLYNGIQDRNNFCPHAVSSSPPSLPLPFSISSLTSLLGGMGSTGLVDGKNRRETRVSFRSQNRVSFKKEEKQMVGDLNCLL